MFLHNRFDCLLQHLAIIQPVEIMLCFHWFYAVCKSIIQVVLISLFSSLRYIFPIFLFIYPSRNCVVDNRMICNEIENHLIWRGCRVRFYQCPSTIAAEGRFDIGLIIFDIVFDYIITTIALFRYLYRIPLGVKFISIIIFSIAYR